MTPLEVQIMLHYHYSPEDFRDLCAPSIRDAINNFVDVGMLAYSLGEPHKITPMGSYYVSAICSIPMPRAEYVIDYPTKEQP